MVQSRVYDFGALLTQARTKTLASRLFQPGIYEGMDPIVVSEPVITLSAGSFLLPNGVLIIESTNVDIAPPIGGWPGVATNYTLTADHEDIQAVGGSSVTYTWRTGILPRKGSPSTNSLAVLWLRHTGATPVTQAMISVPPDVRTGGIQDAVEGSFGLLQAPFPQACNILIGSNITPVPQAHTSGAQHLGLQINNSAASGLQAYQFRLPLPAVPRARFIDIYGVLPNLGSISFATGIYTCVASDGTAVTPTPNIVNGPLTGLTTPIATIALSSTQAAPVTLGVTVNVPALSTGVFLKSFRIRAD